MSLRKTLNDLARVVADEADRNPGFRDKILGALGQKNGSVSVGDAASKPTADASNKSKNRRTTPLFDPIELASVGESALRSRLAELTVDQLQDIVSSYGMDPGRLVTKWKTPERIIERIVELALARSQKGDAFRSDI
jgi:hypothetical protein